MDEENLKNKINDLMDKFKETILLYTNFFKKKLKLYEVTRQYNKAIYELGEQFYTIAKSGINDVKIFSSSIERLNNIEQNIIIAKEEINNLQDKRKSRNTDQA